MLEFTPEEGGAPVTGGVVGAGGQMAEGANGAAGIGRGWRGEELIGGELQTGMGGTPAGDAGS